MKEDKPFLFIVFSAGFFWIVVLCCFLIENESRLANALSFSIDLSPFHVWPLGAKWVRNLESECFLSALSSTSALVSVVKSWLKEVPPVKQNSNAIQYILSKIRVGMKTM